MQSDNNRYFTAKGELLAARMLDNCTVIQDFLTDVLTVDKEIAAADACTIKHVVSADTLCSLCRYTANTAKQRKCTEDCHVPTIKTSRGNNKQT
jgi:Mn-dependent DtxR family transcriptional regulator